MSFSKTDRFAQKKPREEDEVMTDKQLLREIELKTSTGNDRIPARTTGGVIYKSERFYERDKETKPEYDPKIPVNPNYSSIRPSVKGGVFPKYVPCDKKASRKLKNINLNQSDNASIDTLETMDTMADSA